jgi:hypothetical protein
MFKLKAAVAGFSMVLACASVAVLSGCGSPEQAADHDATDKIQQTEIARAAAKDFDDLAGAQKTYDDLANNRDLSKQMQILVRARQTQLRLERITMMVSALRSQELAIGQDIADIEQLAMQVAGAQTSVDALKVYDPATQGDKLTAMAAQIQGSANQLTWTMPSPTSADQSAKVTSPTLFAVTKEIETLTADIQKTQADMEADHKLSAAKADEAETFLRRAEGETGEQQVSDTTSAANDRRDAALADSRAATLANNLARLKANLDRATQQKTLLEAAVKSLQDQIQANQTRWQSVSEQIQQQQKVEQQLIGQETASGTTISSLARDLASKLQDAAGLREKVNDEINAAVQQLKTTKALIVPLRTEWMADVREKQDDPDMPIWKQAQETMHPMTVDMQIASALQEKAAVAAAKARIDLQLYRLMKGAQLTAADAATHFKNLDVTATQGPIKLPGIEELLDQQKTGVKMPAAFGDISSGDPDQLAQERGEVDKDYSDAVDAYDPTKSGATDTGANAQQRRDVALLCGAEVNRQWAQFDALEGDTSGYQAHMQAAQEMQAQIDSGFALLAATPAPAEASHAAAGESSTPGAIAPAGLTPAGVPGGSAQ